MVVEDRRFCCKQGAIWQTEIRGDIHWPGRASTSRSPIVTARTAQCGHECCGDGENAPETHVLTRILRHASFSGILIGLTLQRSIELVKGMLVGNLKERTHFLGLFAVSVTESDDAYFRARF